MADSKRSGGAGQGDDRGSRETSGSLASRYGSHVELDGGDGQAVRYRIVAELSADGRDYAILQSDAMRKEAEIEVFRIEAAPDGELRLATVEDDDEWECVSEAYDDLQFGSDERP